MKVSHSTGELEKIMSIDETAQQPQNRIGTV
jgi:hypothetical protein